MGKIIEIFNRIAYNVLLALYQPFWAAVLLAFLAMFLYLYGREHGWKKEQKGSDPLISRKLSAGVYWKNPAGGNSG